MRAQLEHLVAAAARPNLTLQVMPFAFGGHAAEGGAFSILRFPEPDLPDVVYRRAARRRDLPGQAGGRRPLHRGHELAERRQLDSESYNRDL
jgi:hypothetical protein